MIDGFDCSRLGQFVPNTRLNMHQDTSMWHPHSSISDYACVCLFLKPFPEGSPLSRDRVKCERHRSSHIFLVVPSFGPCCQYVFCIGSSPFDSWSNGSSNPTANKFAALWCLCRFVNLYCVASCKWHPLASKFSLIDLDLIAKWTECYCKARHSLGKHLGADEMHSTDHFC